ncbi:MAG: diacylglycerol/lipid kinase family protein [Actinomycetota bacterium]
MINPLPDLSSSTPTAPRIALAVNPTAGKGRGLAAGEQAAALFRQAGVDVITVHGTDASHAATLIADTTGAGVDAIIVVGGDGMVHLGAGVCAGTTIPFGVVPAGTGNDIAAAFAIPARPEAAVRAIIDDLCALQTGQPSAQPVDAVRRVGSGNPQWFFGVLCGGFDAKVNERANRWSWPKGRLRYTAATVAELTALRPRPYHLELDGQAWDLSAMWVSVANASMYGGGMRIAPDARVDDGLLDVVVIDGDLSIGTFLRIFPRVFSGAHVRHPAVTIRRAQRVHLATDGIISYADGEAFGALPVEVEAIPGALHVLGSRLTDR